MTTDYASYTTADDAMAEIVRALGEYADDFDVALIFAATYSWNFEMQRFEQCVDVEGFWRAVEDSAL